MDRCLGKLIQGVWFYLYIVVCVDDVGFYDIIYYCFDVWYIEGVIDVEFEWSFGVVVVVVWQNVKKGLDQVEVFICYIGDLEDRVDMLVYKLGGCVDVFFLVFDEYWYFLGFWVFQYFGDLVDCLFQNLWWIDVYFGDDNYYGYVQGKGNVKMFFVYVDQFIVCCYYQEVVVWVVR